MLNGKQFSDWATPRPASARSSPSLNDPLEMIKRGIVKSACQVPSSSAMMPQESHPKEHAVDSNFITNSQTIPSRGDDLEGYNKQHQSLPPRGMNHEMMWATIKDKKQYNTNGMDILSKHVTQRPQQAAMPLSNKQQQGMQENTSLFNCGENSASSRLSAPKNSRSYQGKVSNGTSMQDNAPPQSGVNLDENARIPALKAINSQKAFYSSYPMVDISNVFRSAQTVSKDSKIHKHFENGILYPESASQSSLAQIDSVKSPSGLKPVKDSNQAINNCAGKWDHVMNAKDDLIRQKDVVIERQKQTIEQMQQHIKETEERYNQTSFLLMAQRKEDGRHESTLKEAHCQISQLRAQMQQITSTKQEEIEDLQKKLGATEYELQKLEKGFREVGRGQAKEIADLKRKIEERDVSDKNLKKSLEALQDDLKRERRKAQNLQQYLQELPTSDEHQKSLQQIKDIKSEKQKLEDTIDGLEKHVKELRNQIKERDSRLEEVQRSKEDVQVEVKRLSDNLNRYREREKDGPVTLEEFDEAKWESERMKSECERIKKLLEQKHKKMKALHQHSQNTQKTLEERLSQEEDTINVLRAEIESKDANLEDLKTSVKQITAKNQDLMRENLALKDILTEFERLTSAEVQQVHQKVQKELSICVSDIKYLIQLCSETAEGKDPNISVLLGIKGQPEIHTDESLDVENNPFDIENARARLAKIRDLRTEIDKLRTFVSDKYAEEVGNNCITQ